MKFRTSVPILEQEPKIDHTSKILLLGSCFVENIGKKLDYYQFQNLRNPFGIFYHPQAIENFITKVSTGFFYEEKDIFFYNEQWHCFDAHSSLNANTKEELLLRLNEGLQKARLFLENATHVVLTLGTSWYYKEVKNDIFVANCHKIPQKNFNKKLLSINETEIILKNVLNRLLTINSNIHIIFTVSPVRHLKDGFVENQLSKAHLISGIHALISSDNAVNREICSYFPAYEIMLDELRDYRFYENDMIHPSSLAIEYIWAHFTNAWVAIDSSGLFQAIELINKGLAHKAFNEDSQKHQLFLKDLQKKITELSKKIPINNFRQRAL